MCPSPNGKVFAIKEKYRWVDGQRELIGTGYIVEFRRVRALHPWEEDQARRTFQFRGIQYQQDFITPIDPVKQRVSLWDSEWAPEDIRKQVEQVLLNHDSYGRDFVVVESPSFTAPWPNYDEITGEHEVEQITARVEDLGIDVDTVVNYERYNANRQHVIAALEEIGELEEDEIEVPA